MISAWSRNGCWGAHLIRRDRWEGMGGGWVAQLLRTYLFGCAHLRRQQGVMVGVWHGWREGGSGIENG